MASAEARLDKHQSKVGKILKGVTMGLDITLSLNGEEVYRDNITHNMSAMAEAVGLYLPLWRPEDIAAAKAEQLVGVLTRSIARLATAKSYYSTYDPANKWGSYDAFLIFCVNYLDACKKWPEATIEVDR